jgi:PAS domain S-box-containing protein
MWTIGEPIVSRTIARARFTPSARSIVLLYVVVAALWIALSGQIVRLVFADPNTRTLVETIKGWGFVAVTGALLAVLLQRHYAAQAEQAAAMAASEQNYRLLAEHSQDIIFRWALVPTPRVEYASPAVEPVLGYAPSAFTADPGLLLRLVHPDDRAAFERQATSPEARSFVVRIQHADGHWVWVEQRSSLVVDDAGRPVALEGIARDITERQAASLALERINRVQRTLSAANHALVRADDECRLLADFCQATVAEGGFRFAWVGYRGDDEAGTIRPQAHAGHEDGYLTGIQVSWHDVPAGRGPTGTAIREGRTVVARDIATDPLMAPWRDRALQRAFASSAAFPLHGRSGVPGSLGALTIYAAEANAFGPDETALLEELAADLSYGIEVLRTRAEGAVAERERRRLATVVEQSPESIVITNTDGSIEYVNPAFERITGYTKAEVVGQNPRLLKSGVQPAAFYRDMWVALTAGRSWVAEFTNRRKDGALFREEAVVSPVRDETGRTTGYVAVKRDVTAEREAVAREAVRAAERTQIAQALAALHPRATPEETADAVCRRIARLPEAAAAGVVAFDPDGHVAPLAAATADGRGLNGPPFSGARGEHLRTRAAAGPWVEDLDTVPRHAFGDALVALGIRAVAYAPIRVQQVAVGLLEVGSTGPDAVERLTERLGVIEEYASIASAVLGPSISSRAQRGRSRELVRAIIDQSAFHPVFQPIVDLASRVVIGYEALTRFDDGMAPDEHFREAAVAGLGIELECAALDAALLAAGALPTASWLNVNVSPAVVLAGEPLRSIVARYPWRLVLEVTEHEAIADYVTFRQVVEGLGPDVQLAVDDAGAGFASLRHILELRPHMVKIDRSLVAGIDADPARQALLTGLRHFSEMQGCSLVAEGIETEAELATLVGLDVRLGQGYLLGRPAPVSGARSADDGTR